MSPIKMSLELHDSKLKHITEENSLIKIVLEPAIIHKGSNVPGEESGEVWLHKVELYLEGKMPINLKQYTNLAILDGSLEVQHEVKYLIPIQSNQEFKDGHLTLEFGEVKDVLLKLSFTSMVVKLFEPGTFLETFKL